MVLVDRAPGAALDTAQLPGWWFGELKRRLTQQTLADWLGQYMQLGNLGKLHLLAERQRRDSAALLVAAGGGRSGAPRELVLHYTRGERLLRAWWLPYDPFLPTLGRLAMQPLASLEWQPAPAPAMLEAPTLVEQLVYNPGQRATLRVITAKQAQPLTLKLLRPDAFARSLYQQTLLRLGGLAEQVCMPQLVAAAPDDNALLYQYLPGTSLDTLQATLDGALEHQLARLAAGIHTCAAGGLPAWQPLAEIARARWLLADRAACAPALAPAVGELFDRIAGALDPYQRPYAQLIHGDLSAKNVLRQSGRLAVIDWDSCALGPPEKDLASLLARAAWRKQGGNRLLGAYEQLVGQPLDRTLLNLLVLNQRLLKLCRRLLSGATDQAGALAPLESIAGQLQHNPWME